MHFAAPCLRALIEERVAIMQKRKSRFRAAQVKANKPRPVCGRAQ
jgi:hypothetical protein